MSKEVIRTIKITGENNPSGKGSRIFLEVDEFDIAQKKILKLATKKKKIFFTLDQEKEEIKNIINDFRSKNKELTFEPLQGPGGYFSLVSEDGDRIICNIEIYHRLFEKTADKLKYLPTFLDYIIASITKGVVKVSKSISSHVSKKLTIQKKKCEVIAFDKEKVRRISMK